MDIFIHAGIFIYPLMLCSAVAVFITFERLITLRPSRVMPAVMLDAFVSGRLDGISADSKSVVGRIVAFHQLRPLDSDSLKAYAQFEVSRMERGMFLLEVVIGAAPLIGLLGTVTGLTQVFSGFSAETGLPDPANFIIGIALALNTTILGLTIAIPALAVHAYLLRRIESVAACIGLGIQALIQSKEV